MNKFGTIHIFRSDEYLAVANKGKHFTKEGLRAICQAHLSPKADKRSSPFIDNDDAERFLETMRNQRIDAYRHCPDDILEHARAEAALQNEYAGRILQELVQNAHDAISEQHIGNKGVGFKAVLNISESPKIYSGPLQCEFNYESTKEIIAENNLLQNPSEKVPLLRLPFKISDENKDDSIKNLITEYDTVVILPFRNKILPENFLTKVSRFFALALGLGRN